MPCSESVPRLIALNANPSHGPNPCPNQCQEMFPKNGLSSEDYDKRRTHPKRAVDPALRHGPGQGKECLLLAIDHHASQHGPVQSQVTPGTTLIGWV